MTQEEQHKLFKSNLKKALNEPCPDEIREEIDNEFAEIKNHIAKQNLTHDELIDAYARTIHLNKINEHIADILRELLDVVVLQGDMEKKDIRSIIAKKAALVRLAADPRQRAKDFVFNCWQVWREEPERYKFKSDFAKDMLKQKQCESLTSQKVVEDWCREWEKAHLTG